jgi:hypothetical protein
MFTRFRFTFLLGSAALCTLAAAQDIAVLRDLEPLGRTTLSKEELNQLLPGATMTRVSSRGSTQIWKNDSSGSFIVSSDNRGQGNRATTASGKWHISEDGRYCVLIEWRIADTEEWCRYLVKAGNQYYATRSDKTLTEKVHKLDISR